MNAYAIAKTSMHEIHCKPVFSQGIRQKCLHELTSQLDVLINGVAIRLPRGTVLSITSFGSGGQGAHLMHDVAFMGRDGEYYRARAGMQALIPSSCRRSEVV